MREFGHAESWPAPHRYRCGCGHRCGDGIRRGTEGEIGDGSWWRRPGGRELAPGNRLFAPSLGGFVPSVLAGRRLGGWLSLVNPPRASFRRAATEMSADAEALATQERAELVEIVVRAQRGEMAAQSELVRRYTVRISAFVRPILFQPSAVEDVVQMVFIKMVRRLTLLRDPAVFESWLFRLARNTAVDFLRRRRCRPTMVSDEQMFEQAPDTSSERPVAEIMEALQVALTRLSPKDRSLVTMIVEGNSYQTVAAREGLTVGAVKVRLNRVRPFLRLSVGEAVGVRVGAPAAGKWRQPARARLAA